MSFDAYLHNYYKQHSCASAFLLCYRIFRRNNSCCYNLDRKHQHLRLATTQSTTCSYLLVVMSKEVWIQLYAGETKSGNNFPIEIASLSKGRIADLTKAAFFYLALIMKKTNWSHGR
jgi:hypothetical protein